MDLGLKDVPNIVYACFVLHTFCEINGMVVDEEDVQRQIARDREARPVVLPDRLHNFNSAKGVHVRNIITQVFKEYLSNA